MELMGDAELVRRCRKDDARAWRELIRRYSPLVYRIGSRVLGAQHEAEDVSQETFMAAFRSFHTYDATRPFAPWIARIAYNNALKQLRGSEGRRRATQGSDLDLETRPAPDPTPEANTIRAEEKAMVVTALERLAAQDRVLLDLRYREGLSASEVGDVVGMPANTVKTRVFRARGYLKVILSPLIKAEFQ